MGTTSPLWAAAAFLLAAAGLAATGRRRTAGGRTVAGSAAGTGAVTVTATQAGTVLPPTATPGDALTAAAECAERYGPQDPRTIASRRAATDRISAALDDGARP